MAHIRHLMKDKDLNKIAAVEKAIAEKYGAEAVSNPSSDWNEEKEKGGPICDQLDRFLRITLMAHTKDISNTRFPSSSSASAQAAAAPSSGSLSTRARWRSASRSPR